MRRNARALRARRRRRATTTSSRSPQRLSDVSDRFFFWRSVEDLRDTIDLKTQHVARHPARRAGAADAPHRRRPGRAATSATPRVAQMLEHFIQYVGSSPIASPAVLCGIAQMQVGEGVWYPMGGTRAVPAALQALAEDLGVDFRTGVDVAASRRRRRPRCRRSSPTTGERLALRPRSSRTWTACAPTANSSAATPGRASRRGRKREAACSGVVLYLGLDRAYEHLAHHNFVFSRDPEEEFDAIYEQGRARARPDRLPRRPRPHRAGRGAAGRRGALRPRPHALPAPRPRLVADAARLPPHHPRQARPRRRHGATSRAGSCVERTLTPQDIHDRYRVLDGAIYGLASHGRVLGRLQAGQPLAAGARPLPRRRLGASGAGHADGADVGLDRRRRAARGRDLERAAGRRAVSAADPSRGPGRTIRSRCDRRSLCALLRRRDDPARCVARSFRAAASRASPARRTCRRGRPVIVYSNHPSWWDPAFIIVLSRARSSPAARPTARWRRRRSSATRFMRRIGIFGVEPETRAGRRCLPREPRAAILADPRRMLWVTAQGRFADPRERPLRLRSGVAHLMARLPQALALPLASSIPSGARNAPRRWPPSGRCRTAHPAAARATGPSGSRPR